WRNVLPRVAEHAHCTAPDLIGMGDSGKPEIGYRLADHARYLDAFVDAVSGPNETPRSSGGIFLVGIDWGGVLALDWAARHPTRVRGVSVMETFLRPATWSEWSPQGAELFRAYRTPGVGERMVLEENMFLAKSLEHGARNLTDDLLHAMQAL
ncbi:MAG: alpha/beta fold hydrolase, partial [Aquirufa sp.]